MDTLIKAIQTQLRADIDYVRDPDVYITPDVDYLPENVRPPCIGIKDGDISRKEEFGGKMTYKMAVTIVACVSLTKEEAAIIGDSSREGVITLSNDIQASLDENTLGITGMQTAFSPSESGSHPFGDKNLMMQRKLIEFEYEKEGNRP